MRIRVGEPYSYTLTFGSATDILTKWIRLRIQRHTQKAQHFLAPYCGMRFLAICALFLLYIHFGKSLWFTWIPCNEASTCRVSITKQTNKTKHWPVKLAAPRPLRVPRPLSRTLRVCRLTAVVYEYTLRLSSRHFFTAVKLIRKVRK